MNQYWSTRTDRLIELLREHTYLWDSMNPENRNKSLKEYGFAKIANEMNVSVSSVKHKVTNLKSKYRTEIQKIKSAKESGFYYKPLLPWFKNFQDLMESVKRPRESVPLLSEVGMLKGGVANITTLDHNMGPESSQDEEEDSGEEPAMIEEVADNSDTIVVSITQEYIDEVNKAQNVNVTPKSFKKRGQKVNAKKEQVIRPSNIIIDHSEGPRGDEFQMFAEHIAEQLKLMPIESAMSLQNNIQRMLDEVCENE